MVKIINPLGDVKIGRQGEVVYQRKYGEQIRRQVSPKRALASQSQIAHRQLYKNALAWRSQLSLPNRRYLDGYCIANGIVDGYHIPLPWSRFALKLYLQGVKFVIITKEGAKIPGAYGQYEYYITGDHTLGSVYGAAWKGQTFTPQVAHKVTTLKLKLYRLGSPGTATYTIRATDGTHPIGGDLCSGTIDGNGLTLDSGGLWYEITLGAGTDLNASTKYAIVGRAPSGDIGNLVGWRSNTSAGAYAGGNYEESSDSGVNWASHMPGDFMFEEWGNAPSTPGDPGLLYVRHPSLLKIVHKRGDLIVSGYDTLSSLDEEYLTKQVGIDFISGDTIEATTLPGIVYPYLVR